MIIQTVFVDNLFNIVEPYPSGVDSSRKDRSSGFRVLSPRFLRDNKDDALAVDMEPPQLDPDFQYGRTVLVVDDDLFILRYIERALGMAKYKVRTANGENQALALLREQQIDLVLTDIVMGDSDGFRLAARIEECYPGLTVVFMTGALPETNQHAQELCQAGLLLRKPFAPQQLWNFLAGALSKRFTSVS